MSCSEPTKGVAEKIRIQFDSQGSVPVELLKGLIPDESEGFIFKLTTAINEDGILSTDEYSVLDSESSGRQRQLLDDLRKGSPFMRQFERFVGEAGQRCIFDACRAEREKAREALEIYSIDTSELDSGEAEGFIKLVMERLGGLNEDAILENLTLFKGLAGAVMALPEDRQAEWKKRLEPLLFSQFISIGGHRVLGTFFSAEEKIKIAEERLKTNPKDPYALQLWVKNHGNKDVLDREIERYEGVQDKDAFTHYALGLLFRWRASELFRSRSNESDYGADAAVRIGYEKVLSHTEEAVRLDPDNSLYYYQLGCVAFMLEFFSDKKDQKQVYIKKAIDAFEKALEKKPREVDYMYELALIYTYRAKDQIDKAVQIYRRIKYFYNTASAMIDAKMYGEAISFIDKWLLDAPVKSEVLDDACSLLSYKDRDTDRLPYCERLVSLTPSDSSNRISLAWLYKKLGKNDKALEQIEIAKRIDPSADVDDEIGGVYHGMEKYAEAAAAYEEAVKRDPKNSYFYYMLGSSYLCMGNYKKAVVAYKKYVELEPGVAVVNYNLGCAEYNLRESGDESGSYERARVALEKAIQSAPKVGLYHIDLGMVYLRLGRFEDARRQFELALQKLAEGDCPDIPATAKAGLIEALRKLGRLDEALEKAKAAVKLHNDDADVVAQYGLVLKARRDYLASEVALMKAIELDPDTSEEVYQALEAALRALGKNKEADEVRKKYQVQLLGD